MYHPPEEVGVGGISPKPTSTAWKSYAIATTKAYQDLGYSVVRGWTTSAQTCDTVEIEFWGHKQ